MNEEPKKISKIVDEILTYFLFRYGAAAEIVVTPQPDRYRIRFRFTDVAMSDEEFAEFESRLVVKRQPELEDYYWQLAGETVDSNELMIVGMMCDSIEVKRAGTDITLNLVRAL